MLALAIVLLAIVLLLVIVSFVGSSEELVIDFLNVTVTTSVGGVFVAGVVCGLIALASVLALRRSWRRHQERAEEVRELRRLAGVPDGGDEVTTKAATDTTSTGDSAAGGQHTVGANLATTTTAASDTSHDTGEDTGPLRSSEDPPRT